MNTPWRGAPRQPRGKGNEEKNIRKEKKPVMLSLSGSEPGTAPQMASTTAVGPPRRVVPVSIIARAKSPPGTLTF